MNLKAVGWIVGSVLLIVAGLLVVPALVGAWYGEVDQGVACLYSAGVAAALGGGLTFRFRGSTRSHGRSAYHRREGIAAVGLSWLAVGIVGSLPFLFTRAIPSPIDAVFESVSGFTTTGSTILSSGEIDGLSHAIAFWRSFTHWIGGVGIVMIFVLILPTGSRSLFRAEVTGYDREAQSARVRDSAKVLFIIYAILTLACWSLLAVCGVGPLDAAIHTFGTVATGGFSSHGSSVAYFDSWRVETVIVVFMFLSGVNFALYHRAYGKRIRDWIPTLWASSEFRTYFGITVGAVLSITVALWFWWRPGRAGVPDYSHFTTAFRDSCFSVVTMQTCSGFATADFNRWPAFCRVILLLVAFVGGCAGSTAGGLKVVRFVILRKHVQRQLAKFIHPRAVHGARLDGEFLDSSISASVGAYLGLWVLFALLSTALVAASGVDLVSAGSSVLATLNNAGPGLGMVGPVANFGALPVLVKLWLTGCMLAGRLEFYAILSLLLPSFWSQ